MHGHNRKTHKCRAVGARVCNSNAHPPSGIKRLTPVALINSLTIARRRRNDYNQQFVLNREKKLIYFDNSFTQTRRRFENH